MIGAIMHLRKLKKKDRVYLSIVKGFRNSEGKPRSKTVKSLGYVDELEKEYDDPIAHFTEVARQMTEEEKLDNEPITVTYRKDETLKPDTDTRKNLGYAALMKIYHELEIDKFLKSRQQSRDFEYNTNSIMILLLISRFLNPGSKLKAFEDKSKYFERFDFELHDVYRSLSFYAEMDSKLQQHIHEQISRKYGRNTKIVYYDLTNYYFEIDKPDDLRKKGVSKEHRPDPIIQMGLAMDTDGIPISYDLFAGNESEKLTLRPMLKDLKNKFDMKRLVVVADRSINTGDNINYTVTDKDQDGYVFSQTIRGATKEFKDFVMNEEGYSYKGDDFKIKSRIYPRVINVTSSTGNKLKKTIDEKQVVFYSKKYDDKAKADRAPAVLKAREMAANPSRYNYATSKGSMKYIENLSIDDDGAYAKSDAEPFFNEELLAEEEKYDGYYSIVTSELDMTDEEIIDTYKGLWRIEESFKVTKSDLETRPVYLSREDRIRAHFLTCFISLVIARLLERELGYKYSISRILECLKNISCSLESENVYLFNYRSEISDAIGNAVGIDFTKKRMITKDIKTLIGDSKKSCITT